MYTFDQFFADNRANLLTTVKAKNPGISDWDAQTKAYDSAWALYAAYYPAEHAAQVAASSAGVVAPSAATSYSPSDYVPQMLLTDGTQVSSSSSSSAENTILGLPMPLVLLGAAGGLFLYFRNRHA